MRVFAKGAFDLPLCRPCPSSQGRPGPQKHALASRPWPRSRLAALSAVHGRLVQHGDSNSGQRSKDSHEDGDAYVLVVVVVMVVAVVVVVMAVPVVVVVVVVVGYTLYSLTT